MSAIFGKISWTTSAEDTPGLTLHLEAAAQALAHRGALTPAQTLEAVRTRAAPLDLYVAERVGIGAIRSAAERSTPAIARTGGAVAAVSGEFYPTLQANDPEGAPFEGEPAARALLKDVLLPTGNLTTESVVKGLAGETRNAGAFGAAFWDEASQTLFLARDLLGAEPLYWGRTPTGVVFGTEIRGVLADPELKARTRVNLKALDQLLTWPGPVSPETFFTGVASVPPGTVVAISASQTQTLVYRDIVFPKACERHPADDPQAYVEELLRRLRLATKRRLSRTEGLRPGFLLSGGIDSTLVNALAREIRDGDFPTFSVGFADATIDERPWQHLAVTSLGSEHHERITDTRAVYERLPEVLLRGEAPLKESYNGCALMLADMLREAGCGIVFSGEGADELFGGYAGYLLDATGERMTDEEADPIEEALEERMRKRLWGDKHFFYERSYAAHEEFRRDLYAEGVAESFERFSATRRSPVDLARIEGLAPANRRSYLDMKLRVADHELTDHGERVLMTHGIVGRYPFLDADVVSLAVEMPPELFALDGREKFPVRAAAAGLVPEPILQRRKFSFVAGGTPELLRLHIDWVDELLSREFTTQAGFFNPDLVERLRRQYAAPGYDINQTYEEDFLMTVLSFHLWMKLFEMPPAS